MHRSLLVLLDFSYAYDTVWRQKFLFSMKDQGIPRHTSKNYVAGPALRLGAIPLLFVIYINNLAMLLPDSETIVKFAHDVSILSTRRNREDVQAGAQAVVNIVDANGSIHGLGMGMAYSIYGRISCIY